MNIQSITFAEDIERLNSVLTEYAKLQRIGPDAILEKKGRDLGIKIFHGFWALRLKVSKSLRSKTNPVFKGPAFDEAARRGWRVKIRDGLALNDLYGGLLKTSNNDPLKSKRMKLRGFRGKRRLNARALLVAQELAMRQMGAGILGVSFLWYRWRRKRNTGKSLAEGQTGTYLVKNKSGNLGVLSTLEKGTTGDGQWYIRITNYTPGIDVMEQNRWIIKAAMQAVANDTADYVVRKHAEALRSSAKKYLLAK